MTEHNNNEQCMMFFHIEASKFKGEQDTVGSDGY